MLAINLGSCYYAQMTNPGDFIRLASRAHEDVVIIANQLDQLPPNERKEIQRILGDIATTASMAANEPEIDTEPTEEELFHSHILQFCKDRLNHFFQPEDVLDYFDDNGVNTSGMTTEQIQDYIYELSPMLLKDLKSSSGKTYTVLRQDDMTAFCVVDRPEASKRQGAKKLGDDVASAEDQSSTILTDRSSIKNKTQFRRDIDLSKLAGFCSSYINESGGAVAMDDLISTITKRSTYDELLIQSTLIAIINKGKIYKYREGGVNYLTTDPDLAEQKRKERKERLNGEGKKSKESKEPLDIYQAETILSALLKPATHVQKLLSAKEIWLAIQDDTDNEVAFSKETRDSIVSTARILSDLGIVKLEERGSKRGAMSKSVKQRVLKIGLVSQEVKEGLMRRKNDNNLLAYIAELEERLRSSGK